MKQDVQLYVDGQRIDLFEDESLQITSTIQDVKDISKIFTDYSQNFSVKASRNNNLVFKHYHDNDISNGYDARFRSEAIIEVNHQLFRKGTIALTNVQMRNNRAYAYDLTFYGNTVTLPNVIGDDMISSLPYLDNYNHEWSYSNIQGGLGQGLTLNGDTDAIIYPLISPEYRFVFDPVSSITTPTTRNIAKSTTPSEFAGVHQQDLKPAIRLLHIIEAIEDKYSEITFSRDFFSDTDFTELYMWLHREGGNIFSDIAESVVVAGDFAIDTSVINCAQEYVTINAKSFEFTSTAFSYSTTSCSAQLTVTPASGEEYEIIVIDTNNNDEVLYNATGLTSTNVHTITLDGGGLSVREYNIQVKIVKPDSSTLTSVDVAWQTTTTFDNGASVCTNTKNFSITSPLALVGDIIVKDHAPEIKIMDFLIGLFKMFNLTAYVDDSGVIVVKKLDEYYSEGVSYDISQYIDIEESSVERAALFSEIEYKYVKPTTLLSNQFKERNNQEFGSEKFKVVFNGKYVDGEKYLVQLPFEKVVYERLENLNTGVNSNIQYGYFVDKDLNPIKGNPLIFYRDYMGVTGDYIYIKDFNDSTSTQLTTYNRPSNVKSDSSQTLNFDTENDEFALVYNEESLFKNYHSSYINSVFDYRNRIVKAKAVLPLKILTKYALNDRFIINEKSYKINSITTNLLNNKSELELIADL